MVAPTSSCGFGLKYYLGAWVGVSGPPWLLSRRSSGRCAGIIRFLSPRGCGPSRCQRLSTLSLGAAGRAGSGTKTGLDIPCPLHAALGRVLCSVPPAPALSRPVWCQPSPHVPV